MQLFLDSADEAQIRYWLRQGVLDGVTTNPTVLRRAGVTDRTGTLAKLSDLVAPGPLHAEVTSASGGELVSEGVELHRLASNIVVKVPVLTSEGEPCLAEISTLAEAGVRVNATACLSFGQVALAAKAGAAYASVLVGRINDEGGDGPGVLAACRRWIDDWRLPVRLVAASVRGAADAQRSMTAGAHSLTLPPDVLSALVDHKYARHTVKQFLQDAGAPHGS